MTNYTDISKKLKQPSFEPSHALSDTDLFWENNVHFKKKL